MEAARVLLRRHLLRTVLEVQSHSSGQKSDLHGRRGVKLELVELEHLLENAACLHR